MIALDELLKVSEDNPTIGLQKEESQ